MPFSKTAPKPVAALTPFTPSKTKTGAPFPAADTDRAQIAHYRSQIEAFRQFQQCTAELLTLGEALCDLAIDDPEAQKKTPNSKARNRTKSKP
jgi:hypothetical protein